MPARLSAGRGVAQHSNRACRLQPAWSARWRKWIKTTHVVRSISYSSSRARVELSRRAGTALRPRGPRLRRGGGASRHPVLPVLRNFLARMASKTPNGCERHPDGRENTTKETQNRLRDPTTAPTEPAPTKNPVFPSRRMKKPDSVSPRHKTPTAKEGGSVSKISAAPIPR